MTFEELLEKINSGEILAPEIDSTIEGNFSDPEDIKKETYKRLIGKGENYVYGDLLSKKEYLEATKALDRDIFSITFESERECESWFLEEEWSFLPPGVKVMMFWKYPDQGDADHSMVWKRHFFAEFIVGGELDD